MVTEEEKIKHNKEIGARLREIMKMLDISQQEIAEYLDRDLTTVNRYERGEVPIPNELVYYLRDKYKVNLNYLFNGETPEEGVIEYMRGSGKKFYNAQMNRLREYIMKLIYSDIDISEN